MTGVPAPTTVKDVRSFLEHARFYRRFIKDFSKIARPLTPLLCKDVKFYFMPECSKVTSSRLESTFRDNVWCERFRCRCSTELCEDEEIITCCCFRIWNFLTIPGWFKGSGPHRPCCVEVFIAKEGCKAKTFTVDPSTPRIWHRNQR